MTDSTDVSSDFSKISPPTPSSRLIELVCDNLEYSFIVRTSLYNLAYRSRDRFIAQLNSGTRPLPLSVTELLARYLSFVVAHDDLWLDAPTTDHFEFVELLLDRFDADCLRGSDVHTAATTIPGDAMQRQAVVQSYFSAMSFARRSNGTYGSALLEMAEEDQGTMLYAVFGGQGNTTDFFGELRELHASYNSLIEPILSSASDLLLSLVQKASVTSLRQLPQGLNVMQWLQNPDSLPASDYLLSAPISFPIIGLIQLANYAVMCHVLGKSPGQVTESFRGMAGHSQGVVVAAAIAMAHDWTSFSEAVKFALTILFYIGVHSQEVSPQSTVPSKISQQAIENGEGFPTPMLNVSNCSYSTLQKLIDAVNEYLDPVERIGIGLINGPSNIVVCGPILSLCALNTSIRQVKVSPGLDQSKIAFSTRRPEITSRYLPISAPFHSPLLEEACAAAIRDLSDIQIHSGNLRTSVYHTKTGQDLKDQTSSDIVSELVRMITCDILDWPKTTKFPGVTHVIDFGPGGISGAGMLTHRNKEGTGVRVVLMGASEGNSAEFGYRSEIFQRDKRAVVWGSDWLKDHGPKLIRTASGDLKFDTKMTRLLGLPPIMVAGMTPTTVSWKFVSAIMNAGYHVELAGGGYFNGEQMSTAIKRLQKSVPAGRGICLNVIYANPRAISWQIPLIRRLRADGVPIDGVTFGAGVPSLDIANDYIQSLGLRYICFKPGTAHSIDQVITVARINPHFPILLQWTGGRGGGHHSYEDFHEPLLRLYGKIRRCSNIVLIAGSGFGGAEDTYPYLSGQWSLQYGYAPMPFDGCLFGSRMMVAKEARTSRAAKEAIVAAPGIENALDWEKTYQGSAGGVITVRSEMGEPIHKLATRGVLFWREMDETIFSITDRTKRVAQLQKMKQYIIKKLNKDFQKVWFGRNSHGKVVDLQDMTYAEVLRRLIELLYVKEESRWIDPSYIRLTSDFIRRMQGRLTSTSGTAMQQSDLGLHTPEQAVRAVLREYPKAEDQVITYDDARFLILLCQRPGQKPVTFVPDLDENFENWFKKDSLWQSEDVAAVIGKDAGRTCILQGPVAARHSTVADEPVGDILGNISKAHVETLFQERYSGGGGMNSVPTVAALYDETFVELESLAHCQVTQEGHMKVISVPYSSSSDCIPDTGPWFRLLAGRPGTWRHALIQSLDIFQGPTLQENPIRRILAPSPGFSIEIRDPDDPQWTRITAIDDSPEKTPSYPKAFEIRNDGEIVVTLYASESADGALPLQFRFTYHPESTLHPIREVMTGRNDRLRKFYYRLWFGGGKERDLSTPITEEPRSITGKIPRQTQPIPPLDTALLPPRRPSRDLELLTPMDLRRNNSFSSPTRKVFHGREMIINTPIIKDFSDSFEYSDKSISSRSDKTMAPLDFAIVAGWEAMMKAIFPKTIDGEFLKLVHLSNKFQLINGAAPLSSSDQIESSAEILSITNTDAGRVVEVEAVIKREGNPVLELVSQFLFRGSYVSFDVCFQKKVEPLIEVTLNKPADVAVLKSKPWVNFVDNSVNVLGHSVVFQLRSLTRPKDATTWRSIETFGQVFMFLPHEKKLKPIATVKYEAGESVSNPVVEYLQRYGTPVIKTHALQNAHPLGEQDWLRTTAPASNMAYARASGDYNPIHVSRTFARYANLPGTITHGMYTSAAVRQLVEKAASLNRDVRMMSYKASFVSMVLPGDELEVKVSHVAMKEGLRVLSFEAINVVSGEKVLVGEAEVEQQLTTYVFTGQGSQKPDMGMDLYAQSEAAREVWDKADSYFSETYGFYISDIVKQNPKQMTVYFGGRRGLRIRQNYMNLLVESNGVKERFFKHIDETTTSYAFQHKQGLLYSTEFAQPALIIMERAQYMFLKTKGLLSDSAFFAGHSLGEYSALSTIGGIMSFDKLLSVIFYRGLTMQAAVDRDAAGRSQFAMVAVNPSRIHKTFSQPRLQALVEAVRDTSGELLELVNYNIEGQQYVCAGSLTGLDCLADTINHMARYPETLTTDPIALITETLQSTLAKPQPLTLMRGLATIPLDGIDVPFHSSFLLPRMPDFRTMLLRSIDTDAIDLAKLVGKYITNLTGQPFGITRRHFEEVWRITGSSVLEEVLREMERDGTDGADMVAVSG
ncbi:hypothetical protein GJ744_001949 [Endocarpon pusillum]|uniref:Malonyl-CoA:ACP transacylase (MAT) domain-containing protein n=1 Tax=Endocarpon pusillum TaxID=364733 RepID=A0A8H7EA60_9EURO|nr:hypothetical protein GJ744_001949 [Endocarpon pusillum]